VLILVLGDGNAPPSHRYQRCALLLS